MNTTLSISEDNKKFISKKIVDLSKIVGKIGIEASLNEIKELEKNTDLSSNAKVILLSMFETIVNEMSD